MLVCGDCGSDNIIFINKLKGSYKFDFSSVEMRNNIVNAIKENIIIYDEGIQKSYDIIKQKQNELNDLLEVSSVSIEDVLMVKSEYDDVRELDKELESVEKNLQCFKSELLEIENIIKINKEKEINFIKQILSEMNYFYKSVDHDGNIEYDDLFTKSDGIYSGSDSTLFYLSKLYSFSKVFNHNYPIVVDSFRSEELSTARENVVISLFSKLNNQIIFTSTIKKEEDSKYEEFEHVNLIDYSCHQPSHILDSKYVDSIKQDLLKFTITNYRIQQ